MVLKKVMGNLLLETKNLLATSQMAFTRVQANC